MIPLIIECYQGLPCSGKNGRITGVSEGDMTISVIFLLLPPSWKSETIYLFIIVAYKIIILVITLPQGTSTKHKSSVKVRKTEQQQLSARIKVSTVECVV